MIRFSHESVLVSSPIDSVSHSVGRVAVRALGGGTKFLANLFQCSALFHFDTVIGFKTTATER